MRILTRYLIRAHAGPFLFAVSTLTGLLFLNAVAQRLEDLAGKGLGWDVIVEFLYLSLPHTVALTLPMAVLVAVLYAFSDLTANNEITAMKAGGIRPQRMMLPLLGVGVVVAGVMLYFNDQVLPQANHRLKNLLLDINRKSPTFVLREQVVNRIAVGNQGDVYYISASTIDNATSQMTDVAIYDGTEPGTHRTTYAERGSMAFNEARTDLYLTLHDGVSFQTSTGREEFQQSRFETQVLPLRGVGNEMERRAGGSMRSDREMTLAMLDSAADVRQVRLDSLRDAYAESVRTAVLQGLGLEPGDATAAAGSAPSDGPDGDRRGPARGRPLPVGGGERSGGGEPPGPLLDVSPDELPPAALQERALGERAVQERAVQEDAATTAAGVQTTTSREAGGLSELLQQDELTRDLLRTTRTGAIQLRSLEESLSQYRVEYHKKFALAFACVVFVLLGGPLAIRFPRGGLGMVIAASSAIFAVYWAGLIGGESLADRGVAPPGLTMWIPNIVFTTLGLWLFLTMGRESATSRGGGWDDLSWTLRRRLGLTRRRHAPARGSGGHGSGDRAPAHRVSVAQEAGAPAAGSPARGARGSSAEGSPAAGAPAEVTS